MTHSPNSHLRTRNTTRLSLAAVTLFTALSAQAQLAGPSQDVYLGVGALSIATIGYARPLNSSFGLRAEYGGWATISRDDTSSGTTATGTIKANRGGLFADWFPFQNGLRLVGGVTRNEIRVDLSTKGGSDDTFTVGEKKVSLNGETFSAAVTFPSTTPYFGLGYGHHQSKDRGIGFYADVGVMVGRFDSKITTSVLNKPFTSNGTTVTITQADIDTKTQSMRDSLSSVNFLPSVSMGLVYRY